jgi:putative selenate reductase molybdopterin-binding subunit
VLYFPFHARTPKCTPASGRHRITGEIRILQSVHTADIGKLINPLQMARSDRRRDRHVDRLRADGDMVHDAKGRVVHPALLSYRWKFRLD